METILTKIVADKIDWVAKKKAAFPHADFEKEIKLSDRSFYEALSAKPAQFILECKKASPSKGLIREDFDLVAIAEIYGNYAAAVSVLTDEKYFQGDFSFLPIVREKLNCPVLCKDFILDSYQVYLARYYHADAVLLMLSVLNDDEYRFLANLAHQLKMGVLTEVSNEEEALRAVELGASVIGINNRNLRDLSVTLERSEILSPIIQNAFFIRHGKDAVSPIIISESGIYTHQDVRRLAKVADGFLVGSALMAETELEKAVRRLIFGENKVCGLMREQDVKLAYELGAYYGGVIFARSSPRCISLEKARSLVKAAPLCFVGVFQNQPIEFVLDYCKALNLSVVQLHGEEDANYIHDLRAKLPKDIALWKAYGVSDDSPVFEALLTDPNIDRYVLDTKITNLDEQNKCGGTGQVFDWTKIPDDKKDKIMLAGGLTADNVKAAAKLNCKGLDFNSGVEIDKGIKDKAKLTAVFSLLRAYV